VGGGGGVDCWKKMGLFVRFCLVGLGEEERTGWKIKYP